MKQNQTQNVIINLSEIKKKKRRRRKKNIKKTGSSFIEPQSIFKPQYVPKYPSSQPFQVFEQKPYNGKLDRNFPDIIESLRTSAQLRNLQSNRFESVNNDINNQLKKPSMRSSSSQTSSQQIHELSPSISGDLEYRELF